MSPLPVNRLTPESVGLTRGQWLLFTCPVAAAYSLPDDDLLLWWEEAQYSNKLGTDDAWDAVRTRLAITTPPHPGSRPARNARVAKFFGGNK